MNKLECAEYLDKIVKRLDDERPAIYYDEELEICNTLSDIASALRSEWHAENGTPKEQP